MPLGCFRSANHTAPLPDPHPQKHRAGEASRRMRSESVETAGFMESIHAASHRHKSALADAGASSGVAVPGERLSQAANRLQL
jgi:hypothetical protein